MNEEKQLISRTAWITGACMLALATAACGAESGSVDASGAEAVTQELTTCTPQPQSVVLATASSQQSASFAPKYAVDGLPTTRWSSNTAADQWLQLDLGKVVNVSSLNINWEAAYSKAFRVEYSTDGVNNWTSFITSGATKAGVQTVNGIAVTRYLRIHSTQATSFGNVSIFDVTVIGTVDSACGNLLAGPWAFSSEDFDPASFNASTVYSISGNSIAFSYQGKSFTQPGTIPSGIHFKQPVQLVQGGHYRLRLDVSNIAGASTTVFWANLSGAASPTDYVHTDGNGSTAVDFVVSSSPGAAPMIELINHPITTFPGVGAQNFTVKGTFTRID